MINVCADHQIVMFKICSAQRESYFTGNPVSICVLFCRLAMIEENMRKMPEMVAEHRRKVRELRAQARKKAAKSEEEIYLLATGQKKVEGPQWQVFKDSKRK